MGQIEYMGHTVNFRSHKESYKDKQPVYHTPDQWLVFENTHEAIIDSATWELVQKLRGTPCRVDTLGEANPLTGLVFCADCGAKMYNQRTRGNEKKPYPSDSYDCSTYKLGGQRWEAVCGNHHISTKALRTLILETIKAASVYAISNQDEFMEKVRTASRIRQAEAVKAAKRKLTKDRKRITELDGIIKKLYESFAVGRIPEERFDGLLAEYEAEQRMLRDGVVDAEQQIAAFEEETANAGQFLELAKKYTDFSELTTPMINEFIERIDVHAPDRSDGDRVQEVDIYLKFIGKLELLTPELSEEELKKQERLRRERICNRERYRRLKAGENMSPPYERVCVNCGKTFSAQRKNAKYCCPACRERLYRREKREAKMNVKNT